MAATCNPSFVWWQQVGALGYDFVEAVATLLITVPVLYVPVPILAFPSSVPPPRCQTAATSRGFGPCCNHCLQTALRQHTPDHSAHSTHLVHALLAELAAQVVVQHARKVRVQPLVARNEHVAEAEAWHEAALLEPEDGAEAVQGAGWDGGKGVFSGRELEGSARGWLLGASLARPAWMY